MFLICRCMDLIQTAFSTGFGFSVNFWKSVHLNIPPAMSLHQIKPVSKSFQRLNPQSSNLNETLDCHVRLIMPHLPAVTLGSYTPHPYHMPNQNSERVRRNPTIRISRATRVMQWNVSLDREITDPKELRNLDEFLGNQVRSSPEDGDLKHSRLLTRVLFIAPPDLDTHMALTCFVL